MPHQYPHRIGNWWLGSCLGSGYSGSIFRATNVYSGQEVALKVQFVDHECPTNRYERVFYPMLQGGKGMPTLYGGAISGQYDYMAIDLLGASLDSIFRKSGQKVMDLRSVCSIAMQVIERLQFMHTRGILHRDIQLGNCAVGLAPNEKTIYMIDFGFSKQYIDPHTGQHIADDRRKRDFIGNYWFSSVAVHCKGRVPSRRDDMEALALMLIHLLTPNGLSWTRNGVPKTEEAHNILKREKAEATPEDLCRGLPAEFEVFLRYCRRLKFAERPDYERWINEFKQLALDEGFKGGDAFIWPPPEPLKFVQATGKPAVAANKFRKNDVEVLIQELAGLNMRSQEGRQVLGKRDNNQLPAARPAVPAANAKDQNGLAGKKKAPPLSDDEVIELSSDSDMESDRDTTAGGGGGGQKKAVLRLSKASQLMHLVRLTRDATDNLELARLVREFTEVLESSRSRTLTKEGFAFLDALYKQLADPSVYIVPMRTSRRLQDQQENRDAGDVRRSKMTKLVALKRDVAQAKTNKRIAQLVSEFGTTIDKSKSRTLTKDALGFLESLQATIRVLS